MCIRVLEYCVLETAMEILSCVVAITRVETGWFDDKHPLVLLFVGATGLGERDFAFSASVCLLTFICASHCVRNTGPIHPPRSWLEL